MLLETYCSYFKVIYPICKINCLYHNLNTTSLTKSPSPPPNGHNFKRRNPFDVLPKSCYPLKLQRYVRHIVIHTCLVQPTANIPIISSLYAEHIDIHQIKAFIPHSFITKVMHERGCSTIHHAKKCVILLKIPRRHLFESIMAYLQSNFLKVNSASQLNFDHPPIPYRTGIFKWRFVCQIRPAGQIKPANGCEMVRKDTETITIF